MFIIYYIYIYLQVFTCLLFINYTIIKLTEHGIKMIHPMFRKPPNDRLLKRLASVYQNIPRLPIFLRPNQNRPSNNNLLSLSINRVKQSLDSTNSLETIPNQISRLLTDLAGSFCYQQDRPPCLSRKHMIYAYPEGNNGGWESPATSHSPTQ